MNHAVSASEKPINLLMRIHDSITDMTRKSAHIAEFALADPIHFIKMTSREICAELNTSEPTLIRFCQGFGYAGLADFRIDLALALASRGSRDLHVEPHASDRRMVNFVAKQAIAKVAVRLLKEDRTVIFDNGSTVEQLAVLLGDVDPLKIMTSGLVVAQNALVSRKHSVIMTGGLIRPDALSLTGRLTEASIREMRFDTAYLGADSIDSDAGLSTFLEDEAHQTRAMVNSARRVVVLADQSKFHKPSLHWICDTDRVNVLVTDAPLDNPEVQKIQSRGVQVISTES